MLHFFFIPRNRPRSLLEFVGKAISRPDLHAMQVGHFTNVGKPFRINYIDYGYRHGDLSFKSVFLSLFSFHNETMNVWSHLIGFICMLIATINISIDLYSKGGKISEIFAIELYMAAACLCLLFSSIYHWFGCLSEQCHQCLLRLDLTGVALLVSGSYLPGVYYGIQCTIL